MDRNGLRPIAALLSPQCRVILHDRRNCGRSDVVIGGELSEQHQWAEDMAALLKQIGAAPAYAAGGSAGSRTSLTLAVRHPEVVKGVFIWEVSGGPRSESSWPRDTMGNTSKRQSGAAWLLSQRPSSLPSGFKTTRRIASAYWAWTCRNFAR